MDKISVSIIMPLHNAEKFVKAAIESVINQTFTDWELIVIDDYSTDNSNEVVNDFLKKDSRIELINLEKNSGPAIARNLGIETAKGRYLAFLDADDIWKLNKLEKQIRFMKEKDISFSFTGFEFADKSGKGLKKIVKVKSQMTYKMSLKNTLIATSSVILDIDKIGKKNTYMPNVGHEDSATWWKILKQAHIAFGLNESLHYYRRSPGALSSNKIKSMKMKWYLYRRYEEMSVVISMYYFLLNNFNALLRRL